MDSNQPMKNTARRPGIWSLMVLAGGALAWIIVAVVIALARSDDPDAAPPDAPSSVLEAQARTAEATLGALVVTLTPPPTLTPTRTPSPTPSATPSSTTTLTPTRTPSPAPMTAAPTLPNVPIITLAISALPPGQLLSSPSAPTSSATAPPGAVAAAPAASPSSVPEGCVPPAGWEAHEVQAGDTLFAFVLGAGPDSGLTVEGLLVANCLTSRFLRIGQVLYLPPGAAENAPSSEVYVAPDQASGPRPASCPCTITVLEGWRHEQIADAITLSGTSFTGADFLAATGPGVGTSFDIVNARPAGVSMEGYLFPGTYTLGNETTAAQFRDMLLGAFVGAVSGQMQADAAAQGVSFHGALTVASIVQREVRGAEIQGLVASVYYNRLRDGSPLGATVTLQYVLGRSGAWWPRVTSVNVNSPYNTYQVSGLPPGPIANPGLSAITAAIYPPATNYRFHTASCTGGGEVFAETYEEHLRNVNCE